MTIQNPALFAAGFWDWSILDGCFGEGKASISDIDGVIERKGKCLFIETKRPGVLIPQGQQITHQALIKSGHSVLIIFGHTNKPVQMRLLTPRATLEYENANIDDLRWIVEKWWKWANRGPQVQLGDSKVLPADTMSLINRKRWLTTSGLADLPATLTPEENRSLADYRRIMDDTGHWLLADQVRKAEDEVNTAARKRKWTGTEYRVALDKKYADLLADYPEHSRAELEAAGRVAWAWDFNERRQTETIRYLHHAMLADQPREARTMYMDKAEKFKWTPAQLKAELSFDTGSNETK